MISLKVLKDSNVALKRAIILIFSSICTSAISVQSLLPPSPHLTAELSFSSSFLLLQLLQFNCRESLP